MVERNFDVELSVIVPVGSRQADPATLHAEYKAGLDTLGHQRFTVISLSRSFGEATALMAGFEHASGQAIVTLPAYHQIDARDIGQLVGGLESADVVIGRRWPRVGGPFERLRRAAFHGLLGWVTRLKFNDLGCGARALDRRVLEEIQLYGDQHRFLAVLADRQGFRVHEVNVRQSKEDRFEGVYQPREYTRGLLDIFTVFFLVRFTKKPLRFFGMVGVTTFAVGALAVTWLVIERLFFDQALAERPALLLASLLVVLGLQLFALGLLGELMIFTHARGLKDYQIERVIQFRDDRSNSKQRAVRT